MTEPRLKIALTKGRVEQQVLPLLEEAGLDCSQVRNKQRRLIFDSETQPYEFILAKGPDVTTFLERGAADIGIVGSDILTEHESTQYELLDLGVGKCQFVLASTADFDPVAPRRKIIGTKYPLITNGILIAWAKMLKLLRLKAQLN